MLSVDSVTQVEGLVVPCESAFEHMTRLLETDRAACLPVATGYLAKACANGDLLLEMQANHAVGASWFALGDVDAAERHLRRAYGLSTALRSSSWRARLTRGMGVIASYRQDVVGAIDLFSISLDMCRAEGDHAGAAEALLQLSQSFARLGMFTQALPLLREARLLHLELGMNGQAALNVWWEGTFHCADAVLSRRSGDLEGMTRKALLTCETIDIAMRGDRSAVLVTCVVAGLLSLGCASLMRGDSQTAQAAINEIDAQMPVASLAHLPVGRDILRATTLRVSGEPRAGLDVLTKTFAKRELQSVPVEERLDYHEELAMTHESLNDMRSALVAWRQFHAEESRWRNRIDRSRAALMAHYFDLDRIRRADEIETILRQQRGARQVADWAFRGEA
jgi:tetratricopeptide (TPR) repeat protein